MIAKAKAEAFVKANGNGTNQNITIALLSDIKYNGLNAPLSWRWGDANGVLNSRGFSVKA